ncbi:PREDICTED: mucin-5AC-like [Branchiostoma belcheri]|uniref:Large ribosomal subunit protein mL38 n=1 Tax=Branchiostoma belcheri TaxID=7741 RepID=A0A6P4Z5X7_BRABE|nr:PREDICTED: mucin-5AC-like [Branchiostoma belcheri]
MLSTLITLTTLFVLSNAQSWVPSGYLPVDFTLTFSAPQMVYDVCSRSFTQSARTVSVDTTGVSVTPGETANDPTTMTITGASSGDMFTILMVDPDTPAADVGTTEKPLLHMLITNITNADPTTGAVLQSYQGPMPPPCSGDHTYHYLLLRQTAALSLTVNDLPNYTPDCTNPRLPGRCLFEVANFISSNQLTPVGYVTMVGTTDGYVRYQYVNNRGISEAQACQGLDGYDPCPTAPPGSSGKKVMMSMSAVMVAACARTISVATTGVSVTPGETAHHPTAMISGVSSGDLFTILMVDPDTSSPDVGTTEKPLLHMLITDITSAEPGTASVLERYRGPMPPPCSGDHTYHCLLLKQTAALSLTVDDLPGYASHCTNYGLAGWCLFEVANFISSNQLTPVGYVTMVAATDGYVRYQYVNGRGIGEAESCRGLDGYDPCSTSTAPPSSSSEKDTTEPPSSSSEKDTTEPPSSSSEKDTTEPTSSSSEKDTTALPSGSSEKDTTEPPSSSSENDTTEPTSSSSEKDTTAPPSSSSEKDTTAPPSSSSEEDTTAPPSSSSEKVMMSLCAVMASALCLIFSFISVLN